MRSPNVSAPVSNRRAHQLVPQHSVDWRAWANSTSRLINLCYPHLRASAGRESVTAVWLLDRLCSGSPSQWICRGQLSEQLQQSEAKSWIWLSLLVFGYARRIACPDDLFRLPIDACDWAYAAALAGWTRNPAIERPQDLLDWPVMSRVAELHQQYATSLAVKGFVRRVTTPSLRRRYLLRAVTRELETAPCWAGLSFCSSALDAVTSDLVADFVADASLSLEDPEACIAWYQRELARFVPPAGEIVSKLSVVGANVIVALARAAWGQSRAMRKPEWAVNVVCEDAQEVIWFGYRALWRALQRLPCDKTGAALWGRVLSSWRRGDEDAIRAFCAWLPQSLREVCVCLRWPNREIESIAFHAFLGAASRNVSRTLHASGIAPKWKRDLLNRLLFAPKSIRPTPMLASRQEFEGDIGLFDPFSSLEW